MYKIEVRKRKNSKKFSPILQFCNIDEVVRYVKEKGLTASSPYYFSHLDLSDGSIITQEVMGLMCSPTKLRDLLEVK